eukprot:scaffold311523_cov35-Tisochrysis_lutea.AAC.1
MAARAARYAAWQAERSTWRLANRGDTRYAAEKRLYRKQIQELRRELQQEDLLARRAAYIAARQEAAAKLEDPEAAARAAEQKAMRKAESEARAQRFEEKARQEYERHRLRAAAKTAKRHEDMVAQKREWLKDYLQRNDVSGKTDHVLAALERGMLGERVVTWLNPENIDSKLTDIAWRSRRNPVDDWNAAARAIIEDEERERTNERLGGSLPPDQRYGVSASIFGPESASVEPETLPSSDIEEEFLQGRLGKVAEAVEIIKALEGRGGTAAAPDGAHNRAASSPPPSTKEE